LRFWKFTTRGEQKRQNKIREKIAYSGIRLVEIIAGSAALMAQLETQRLIADNGGEITGWVQFEITRAKTGEKEYFKVPAQNLLNNSGRDLFHAQCYTNTGAGTRGGGVIALTTDPAAASAANTSLASEITTGGLARADAATKSHTSGTNTSTIEHTFTATAIHTNVHRSALFNAATPPVSGTMCHEAVLPADVTLQINDTVKITWTLTLG